MFWTFNLSVDILATIWATFPNIGQIFVQFSGHSEYRPLISFVIKPPAKMMNDPKVFCECHPRGKFHQLFGTKAKQLLRG